MRNASLVWQFLTPLPYLEQAVVGKDAKSLTSLQRGEVFIGTAGCLGCNHLFGVTLSNLSALVVTCPSCGAHNVFLGGADALETSQQTLASVEPFA